LVYGFPGKSSPVAQGRFSFDRRRDEEAEVWEGLQADANPSTSFGQPQEKIGFEETRRTGRGTEARSGGPGRRSPGSYETRSNGGPRWPGSAACRGSVVPRWPSTGAYWSHRARISWDRSRWLDTLTPGSCERECKFAPVGLSVQMCSMTETGFRPTVSSRAAWISSKTSGSTSFDRMAFKASRASKVPICPKAHAAWPLTNGEL